jgi:hypothetical protein
MKTSMEPPVYSDQVKKKSNVGLIVGLVVAGVFLCCGLLGFGAYFGIKSAVKVASPMLGCSSSLADFRDAVVAYAKKHDGKLPPAKTWEDDVRPYLVHTKMPDILQGASPKAADESCDPAAPSEIVYNSSLAGKPLSSIDPSEERIVLFEAAGTGPNKSQRFEVQPFASSPRVFNSPRGWIQQPLYGDAFMINSLGQRQPIGIRQNGAHLQIGK